MRKKLVIFITVVLSYSKAVTNRKNLIKEYTQLLENDELNGNIQFKVDDLPSDYIISVVCPIELKLLEFNSYQ